MKFLYFLMFLLVTSFSLGQANPEYKVLIQSDRKYSMTFYKIYSSGNVLKENIHFDENVFSRMTDFALSNQQNLIAITRADNSIWLYDLDAKTEKKIFQCPFKPSQNYYMLFNGDRNRIWELNNLKFDFYIGSHLKEELGDEGMGKTVVSPELAKTLKNEGNYYFDIIKNKYYRMSDEEFKSFAVSKPIENNDYLVVKKSLSENHASSFKLTNPSVGFDLLVDGAIAFHFNDPPDGYFWLHQYWLSENVILVLTRYWFSVVDIRESKLLNKTDFVLN